MNLHAAPQSVKTAISVNTAEASDVPGRALIYAIIITVRPGIATRNRVPRKWEYPGATEKDGATANPTALILAPTFAERGVVH